MPPRAKAKKDVVCCNTSSETQEVLWQKLYETHKKKNYNAQKLLYFFGEKINNGYAKTK